MLRIFQKGVVLVVLVGSANACGPVLQDGWYEVQAIVVEHGCPGALPNESYRTVEVWRILADGTRLAPPTDTELERVRQSDETVVFRGTEGAQDQCDHGSVEVRLRVTTANEEVDDGPTPFTGTWDQVCESGDGQSCRIHLELTSPPDEVFDSGWIPDL
jgi:hypothetical protein